MSFVGEPALMSMRFSCPYCKASCQVDDRHLGMMVQCGQCKNTFVAGTSAAAATKVDPAPSGAEFARLDIGGATSTGRVRKRNEDSFLVLQQSWTSMGQQRELALLIVADGMGGYEA